MELYHKNSYLKYRKNHYKIRDSFNQYKRKYISNNYNYNEALFQKNYQKNKDNKKTSTNSISSTEKNAKIDDTNIDKINNDKYKIYKEKKHNSYNIDKDNIISNFNLQNNELYNKNNYNKKNNQLSKIYPYYNILNNNNYYINLIPNNINNYYINNNIIIQNNTYQYQNLYSILNSYNNTIKAINPYLSNNNLNNILFSKNDKNISNDKVNNIIDPKRENTCILEINLKFSKDKSFNFKLKRFDDLFETVQIFCQINELNNNFYLPIIINIMKALNCIYGIYNLKLTKKEIEELQFLKKLYYNTKIDPM